MAVEERDIVRLKDNFYRDGYYKVVATLLVSLTAVLVLVALSLYLFFHVPPPVTFSVDNELRVLPPVPVEEPYVNTADLLQWISDVLPAAFTFDFVEYDKELKQNIPFFTLNGWKKYNEEVNLHANSSVVQKSRLFINCTAAGGPFILSKGLLNGRYSWWVQMPVNIHYAATDNSYNSSLVIQALVVRVPTIDDLTGLGIENLVITKAAGRATTNG